MDEAAALRQLALVQALQRMASMPPGAPMTQSLTPNPTRPINPNTPLTPQPGMRLPPGYTNPLTPPMVPPPGMQGVRG